MLIMQCFWNFYSSMQLILIENTQNTNEVQEIMKSNDDCLKQLVALGKSKEQEVQDVSKFTDIFSKICLASKIKPKCVECKRYK